MSFFYNLNDKLNAIREKPEVTHKQLNERDEGKPGKNFAKIAKDAGDRYGSKAAGGRVAGSIRNKLRDQGKLEERQVDEISDQLAYNVNQARAGQHFAAKDKADVAHQQWASGDNSSMKQAQNVSTTAQAARDAKSKLSRNTELQKSRGDRLGKQMYEPATGQSRSTPQSMGTADGGLTRMKKPAQQMNHNYEESIEEEVKPPVHYGGQGLEGQKFDIYMQNRKNALAPPTPLKISQGDRGDDTQIGESGAAPLDYDKVLQAIAALYGDDMWENDAMGDLANDLEQAGPTDRELDFIIAKGKLPTRLKSIRFTNTDDVQFGHLDEKSGAPMTATGKKLNFADKIAGAKKEVDEMLGDVAAEAMRSALSPKQKKIDMNKNGKLDANDFAMLRKGGKNAEMDENSAPGGFGPAEWAKVSKLKARLMAKGMEPEEAEETAADQLGFDYYDVLDYLDSMNEEKSKGTAFDMSTPRQATPRVGSVERGHKHDIKHTATGRMVTRRTDPQGNSVGADDASDAQAGPRGRGRPKGTKGAIGAKGPSGTSKLMTREGDNESSELKAAMMLLKKSGYKVTKAESTNTRDDHAEKAGKRVTKDIEHDEGHKGKDANKAEKAGKKVTKDIEYDEKKKAVDEDADDGRLITKKTDDGQTSTTSSTGRINATIDKGQVTVKPAKTGSMSFGKGIYDSMNRELESMIAESMSINMSDSTEGNKSLTITATDDDALKLAMMLKAAGLGGGDQHGDDMHSHEETCPTCGMEDCGCGDVQEAVDENAPDWPTNTETSDNALQYSGGLNKPKTDVAGDGQTTIPNTAVHTQDEDMLRRLKETAGINQANLKPWERTMKEDTKDACHHCHKDPCECDEDIEEDFLESIQRMRKIAGIKEAKKPDFPDLDKDGDKKEPMSKAIKDKEEKKVDESIFALTNQWKAYKG